jgi:hypothetical protein
MQRNGVVAMCDGHDVYLGTEKNGRQRQYIYLGGSKVWLHHYLADKYIRPLTRGELVHHRDFNELNNNVLNLQILSRSEHVRLHKPVLGYRFTKEQRKKLSESHRGQRAWNKGMHGFRHSQESKHNMSKAQKGRLITWGSAISKAKTKVTEEQLIEFLSQNPHAVAKDVMSHFNIKSKGPIHKNGGLTKLKEKAKCR